MSTDTFQTGQVALSGAEQDPVIPNGITHVVFSNPSAANDVVIGVAGVTALTGFSLPPRTMSHPIPILNAKKLRVLGTAGQRVSWMAVST